MRLAILIASLSAAVLGYEVALMRALSVARWHHSAHMIVSVALLGFGASGTLITLLRRRLARHVQGWLGIFAAGFAIGAPLALATAQHVPFDAFQLVWDWHHALYLLADYLLFFVPFCLAGACLGLAFVTQAERIHRLYSWNLLGSGLGAVGMVAVMFAVPPAQLPLVVGLVAGLGAVSYASRRLLPAAGLGAAIAGVLILCTVVWPLKLEVSQHKRLSYLLEQPGTRIAAERAGPLGLVQVVASPNLHFTDFVPGLSMAYQGEYGEPEVRALLTDADSPAGIYHLKRPEQKAVFDYTTLALPYHLLERPRTLIVGAGGGSDILLARHHECRKITALEPNPDVLALMRGSQADFAQHVYDLPGVSVLRDEMRGYLAASSRRFDLIQLPLVESFGAAAAGVHGLTESTLYTVEAVHSMLDHLAPGGVLCLTRWMKTPPGDAIRLFATVTEALRRRGVEEPGRRLAFIRGWSTGTLLVAAQPLTPDDTAAVRRFCQDRSFDLVWLPGMSADEANEFNQLPEPYYADAARQLLSPRRQEFLDAYALDISPTTDDRPFHALTFRWRAVAHLRSTLGAQWVSYLDLAYPVLLATVVQAAIASVVLILLPLAVLRRGRAVGGGRLATLLYFGALGLAFMFLELVMIQKLSLFLASPIYAAAVVLGSFMVFSGLGSRVAGTFRHGARAVALGVLGILGIGAGLWLGMDPLFAATAGQPWGVRVAIATACSGALAFFMGMPFPSGLRRLGRAAPALTPWAWGINGCASVVGAASTPILTVAIGFRSTLLIAFALYAVAGLVFLTLPTAAGAAIRESH
jgi:spermidine synthase